MYEIIFAGISNKGRVRKLNEDNWFADPIQGLFIVSDGVGGHAAGDLASKIVVEALPPLISQHMKGIKNLSDPKIAKHLVSALSELSYQIRIAANTHTGLAGMGATVVLALYMDSFALIAHAGDSRAYLIRKNCIKQLTRDHSIVQMLIDSGEISPDDSDTHPARGQITQCMGMNGELLPETCLLKIFPEDRVLLCSDGLTGMLPDEKIVEFLNDNDNPQKICQLLIDEANSAGGKDNITALILKWHKKS